jgi:exodeoxyribonuclease-5
MSVVDLRLDDLPTFDFRVPAYALDISKGAQPENTEDEITWWNEAAAIAEARRSIVWRSPSRHEMPPGAAPAPGRDEIVADATSVSERLPPHDDVDVAGVVRGSRERGLVVHKLLEEVLTGETPEQHEALETRARTLLVQLGTAEALQPEEGPYAPEMAATTLRALAIPEIAGCRGRLLPELTFFPHKPTTKVQPMSAALPMRSHISLPARSAS